MKKLPLRLTKYHFFPEITSIPAELWDELVKRLKREMPKPARPKVGTVPTNMWNSILDPNGTVTRCPPPPKGIPADEMSKLCSHIARAERIFVSSYEIDAFTLPRFTRDLTDVELAFMAVVGYYSDDMKMTRDALNRLCKFAFSAENRLAQTNMQTVCMAVC